MPITRKFIDPKSHALQAAAKYLFKRFTARQSVDLGNVVVVVPGSRAGRRLLEILVEVADSPGCDMIPPDICTVGQLPERLYRPQRPFANELTQQLAWGESLRIIDRETLNQVIGNPPNDDDTRSWLELGRLLQKTHRELAAEGLNFQNVVRATAEAGEMGESERWDVLRFVQEAYLQRLLDLELWDKQTARLVAVEKRECATQSQLVLVGTVDINHALRQMLDQVADQVTALIPADELWVDRFDEHGCLRPDVWKNAHIDLPDDRVLLADDPADVAETVVRCIARFAGRRRADEITVGVPDSRIVPQIERVLELNELPARWGPGRPIAETGPYRLLEAVARYVDDGRYDDFAALIRHPDVFAWLRRNDADGDWLTGSDEYFGDRLPSRLGKNGFGSRTKFEKIEQARKLIDQLVQPLRGVQLPLGDWAAPLVDLIAAIYGQQEYDRSDAAERAVLTACDKIHSVLAEEMPAVPEPLMPDAKNTSVGAVVSMVLERVRAETVAAPADQAAIELLGWLELPLDDAPAVIVTNFNEGFVPNSVNADLLLPDSLRRRLGLEDNARRYARDAYALSVILAARDDVFLIVARRNSDHDPLAPSRLLFAADRETMARRALRFFDEQPPTESERPSSRRWSAAREDFDFPYLKPEPLPVPITSLSPTGFRDYLACPYRFYLRHVLRLKSLADDARELDGGAFGTLLHEVLRRFGESEHRDSTDVEEIRRALDRELNNLARNTYGLQPLAAVSVQVEQARLRLNAFAERQAEWAQEWQIEHTEFDVVDKKVSLTVDGSPFYLRGRIDRVDVHRETGQRVVLDYKSSDTATTPGKAHQKAGDWIDLQLPLYRHLVRATGIEGPVKLGYVQLPRDVSKVEFCLAEWSDDELASADEAAASVIRQLRDEVFWPPTDPPPAYSEEYAWLCHDGVFDRPAYR
jgi:ATP-dependent helicase/nuclease subunit B